MKHSKARDEQVERLAERRLYQAILTLSNQLECQAFFRDLCTPAELQAMADRWRAAELLEAGTPYREIQDRTGVSVTTVGRVARFLEHGYGGYRTALDRIDATEITAARPVAR